MLYMLYELETALCSKEKDIGMVLVVHVAIAVLACFPSKLPPIPIHLESVLVGTAIATHPSMHILGNE